MNRTLVRERLCTKCAETQSSAPNSPNRSQGKSLFTPSKLHLLEGSGSKNAVSSLWSADTETDCDSDVDSEELEDQLRMKESVKENLSTSLSDEVIMSNSNNANESEEQKFVEKTATPSQLPVHVARTPSYTTTTPKDEFLLRSLCNASFSDTQSAASSVSSRGSLIPRRSPAVQTMCMGCNVSFGTLFQRILCSRCTKNFCEGCSTTSETTHYGMVYQQRVCNTCVNIVPDTPFTPGTVHLEEASSVASSIPSGDINRNVAARLWSGGSAVSEYTEHTEQPSPSGSTEENEDEEVHNISVDSITENLHNAIDEETSAPAATTSGNETTILNDINVSDTWGEELNWEVEDPELLIDGVDPVIEASLLARVASMAAVHYPNRARNFKKVFTMILVVWVALCAVLWQPVYAFVETEPAVLNVAQTFHTPPTEIPLATPATQLVHPLQAAVVENVHTVEEFLTITDSVQQQSPPVVVAAGALPALVPPIGVARTETAAAGTLVTTKLKPAAGVVRILPAILKNLFRNVVSKLQKLVDNVRFNGLRLFSHIAAKLPVK